MSAIPSIPAALPPVPAKIHPRQQPGRPMPQRPPMVTSLKTAFDGTPPSTLAARQAAERARTNMQAAVRATLNAKQSVAELDKLTAADANAAAIAEHEGVSPAVTAQFTKLADPLIAAFTVATAAT
ncbi:MAG: hypothetical protein ACYC67_10445 [Prosthecobacter sp.]